MMCAGSLLIACAPVHRTAGVVAPILARHHARASFTVMGLTAGGTLAFYAYTTYMQKFLVGTSRFDKVTASRIMTAALFGFMLLQPAVGALSDRVGRRPVMIAFGALGAAFTYPIFRMLEDVRSPWAALALVSFALIIVSGYTAINAVVKAELFPSEIRTLGVALPYAIANAVFGGSAEYVALWFKAHGVERGFCVYVAGLVTLSLVVYVRMKEPKTHGAMVE
jgi:MHS family alpha-ketoglutarate permease-like MFS transporter